MDGQLRGIVCANKKMISAKKISYWASVGVLLSVAVAMVYVKFLPAPSQSSPLRLAFFDGTSPEARVALQRHIDDLDGVIGEWLKVNSTWKHFEEEDPNQDDANPSATVEFIRSTRPLTMFALVSDEPAKDRGFAYLGDPEFRRHLEQQLLSSVQKFKFDGLIINFDEFEMGRRVRPSGAYQRASARVWRPPIRKSECCFPARAALNTESLDLWLIWL